MDMRASRDPDELSVNQINESPSGSFVVGHKMEAKINALE
jgi:hypothetical protein